MRNLKRMTPLCLAFGHRCPGFSGVSFFVAFVGTTENGAFKAVPCSMAMLDPPKNSKDRVMTHLRRPMGLVAICATGLVSVVTSAGCRSVAPEGGIHPPAVAANNGPSSYQQLRALGVPRAETVVEQPALSQVATGGRSAAPGAVQPNVVPSQMPQRFRTPAQSANQLANRVAAPTMPQGMIQNASVRTQPSDPQAGHLRPQHPQTNAGLPSPSKTVAQPTWSQQAAASPATLPSTTQHAIPYGANAANKAIINAMSQAPTGLPQADQHYMTQHQASSMTMGTQPYYPTTGAAHGLAQQSFAFQASPARTITRTPTDTVGISALGGRGVDIRQPQPSQPTHFVQPMGSQAPPMFVRLPVPEASHHVTRLPVYQHPVVNRTSPLAAPAHVATPQANVVAKAAKATAKAKPEAAKTPNATKDSGLVARFPMRGPFMENSAVANKVNLSNPTSMLKQGTVGRPVLAENSAKAKRSVLSAKSKSRVANSTRANTSSVAANSPAWSKTKLELPVREWELPDTPAWEDKPQVIANRLPRIEFPNSATEIKAGPKALLSRLPESSRRSDVVTENRLRQPETGADTATGTPAELPKGSKQQSATLPVEPSSSKSSKPGSQLTASTNASSTVPQTEEKSAKDIVDAAAVKQPTNRLGNAVVRLVPTPPPAVKRERAAEESSHMPATNDAGQIRIGRTITRIQSIR